MDHLKAADPTDRAAVAHLAREAEVLSRLRHPDVVELVGWDPSLGRLRTALAGRHTLATLDVADVADAAVVAGQLRALRRTVGELHEQGWSHGRIRPEHVVVGPGGRLTLCSFGAADRRAPGHPDLLRDHHDLATLGRVLLERLPPTGGRRERHRRRQLGAVLDAVGRAPDPVRAADAWAALDGGAGATADTRGAPALLGLAALGAGAAVAVARLGARLSPQPTSPAGSVDIVAAVAGVARWSAVAALAYLALVALAAGVALAARAGGAAATILRAAPAPVRRTLGGVVGMGVLSLVAPRPTGPPAPPAPTTAVAPSTTSPRTTAAAAPSTASTSSSPTTSPSPSPSELPVPVATPETHRLAPGEHLWAVAERTVTERLGRAPTEREVRRYWTRLVERNRSRLADPANPDLVFVGQVVELPD